MVNGLNAGAQPYETIGGTSNPAFKVDLRQHLMWNHSKVVPLSTSYHMSRNTPYQTQLLLTDSGVYKDDPVQTRQNTTSVFCNFVTIQDSLPGKNFKFHFRFSKLCFYESDL